MGGTYGIDHLKAAIFGKDIETANTALAPSIQRQPAELAEAEEEEEEEVTLRLEEKAALVSLAESEDQSSLCPFVIEWHAMLTTSFLKLWWPRVQY